MTKKVMLFYADWCGHCKTFAPIWEELKKDFDQRGIAHEEHESSNQEIMDVFDVQGFPTIKIEQAGVVSDYRGSRDKDSILSYVSEQSGGGRNYHEKYIDMKNKYVYLRRNVMSGGAQNSQDSTEFEEEVVEEPEEQDDGQDVPDDMVVLQGGAQGAQGVQGPQGEDGPRGPARRDGRGILGIHSV